MNKNVRTRIALPTSLSRVPSGSGLTGALLFGDDLFELSVLGDVLRDFGVSVIAEATGAAASLAKFDAMAELPSLVMCDLDAWGSDHGRFMQELGTRGYGGGIVVISGSDLQTMNAAAGVARFHGLRIVAFLGKPIRVSSVGAALANLARSLAERGTSNEIQQLEGVEPSRAPADSNHGSL